MPDQESIRGQLNLLDTLRKRLRIQLDQKQKMGTYAPPFVQMEIDDAQAQIKKIKAYLMRNGVMVDDLAEDGEEETQTATQTQTPSNKPDPKTQTDTADFVIITALEEERDAVLAHLPGNRRIMPSAADIRTYRFARIPVNFPDGTDGEYGVAVLSLISMGRVEASLATSDAIRRWSPRYVLMVGIAGGIGDEGVKVGDVLLSSQVIDYELQKLTSDGESIRYSGHRADPRLLDAAQNMAASDWRPEVAAARPEAGQPKRVVGPVATGDKVVARKALLDKLRADWPKLVGIEMEAGGAAAAAFQSAQNPGFFMVRGVSDLADEHKGDDWREYACDVAAAYTIALLKSGPVPLK